MKYMWHLELEKLMNVRNTKQKTWHGLRKLVKFKSGLLSLTFVLLSSAKSICSVVAASSWVNMVDAVARFINWDNFLISSIGRSGSEICIFAIKWKLNHNTHVHLGVYTMTF